MQITNEEMETLNRASEILSKYADQGDLSQEDFDHFERMVIAIIDGIEDKEDPNYQEIRSRLEESNTGQPFPTTKWKIGNSMLQRDVTLEKQYGIDDIRLYGYFSDTTSMVFLVHHRREAADEQERLAVVQQTHLVRGHKLPARGLHVGGVAAALALGLSVGPGVDGLLAQEL